MKFEIEQPQAIYELGKRDNQEDAIYPKIGKATVRDRLFILCDGMGGHEHGEVASNTVSSVMADYLDKHASADDVVIDEVLRDALEAAYLQLDSLDDGTAKKMGTTLCLLLFHRGGLTTMHIGDSRIYHVRPSEHKILYQSKDHSLVYDLYQAGEIEYDEMRTSPKKNIITRAIQPGEDNRTRPSVVHIADIRPGDYFYICSDGMLEQMENDELCNIFSSDGSDEKKRQQLIAATMDNKDNHSAYFIHIKNVTREEGDENLPDDEQTNSDNALLIEKKRKEAMAQSDNIENVDDDVEVVDGGDNVAGKDAEASDCNGVKEKPLSFIDRIKNNWYYLFAVLLVVCVVVAVVVVKPWKSDKEEELTPVTVKFLETENKAKTVKPSHAPHSQTNNNEVQADNKEHTQQADKDKEQKDVKNTSASSEKTSSKVSSKDVKNKNNAVSKDKPGDKHDGEIKKPSDPKKAEMKQKTTTSQQKK